jgi:hypothetical protein
VVPVVLPLVYLVVMDMVVVDLLVVMVQLARKAGTAARQTSARGKTVTTEQRGQVAAAAAGRAAMYLALMLVRVAGLEYWVKVLMASAARLFPVVSHRNLAQQAVVGPVSSTVVVVATERLLAQLV